MAAAPSPEQTPTSEAPDRLSVVSGVASGVAKLGGAAAWAAGSYISSVVSAKAAPGQITMSEHASGPSTVEAAPDGTLRGLGSTEVLKSALVPDQPRRTRCVFPAASLAR